MMKRMKQWMQHGSLFLILSLTGIAMVLSLAMDVRPVGAASYPTKPINWIVMWPAGGGADTGTRMFTKHLSKILGQEIIVQNIVGGGGSIGYLQAKGKRADGYNLVTIQADLPKYPVMKLAPIDVDDFDIIGSFCAQPPIIVTRADSPWQTLNEFIADAKKNPGKRTIGVSDIGGVHHQPIVLLMKHAGFDARVVAHKGSTEMAAAILGGHVDVISTFTRPVFPYIAEKKLRFLATTGSEPISGFPNVPTLAKLGYPVEWMIPWGIGGPKGMPENVKKILADATRQVWANPEFVTEIDKLGYTLFKKDGPSYRAELLKMQKDIAEVLRLLEQAK